MKNKNNKIICLYIYSFDILKTYSMYFFNLINFILQKSVYLFKCFYIKDAVCEIKKLVSLYDTSSML